MNLVRASVPMDIQSIHSTDLDRLTSSTRRKRAPVRHSCEQRLADAYRGVGPILWTVSTGNRG